MVQGFACHARGVELQQATAERVRARVRSKRLHEVDLRAERSQLSITCSCAATTLDPVPCKHAWAALLEVDRSGGLDELRRLTGALDVVPSVPELTEPPAAPAEPRTGKKKTLAKTRAKAEAKAKAKASAPEPSRKKEKSRR
jgi:hypothetical protein